MVVAISGMSERNRDGNIEVAARLIEEIGVGDGEMLGRRDLSLMEYAVAEGVWETGKE